MKLHPFKAAIIERCDEYLACCQSMLELSQRLMRKAQLSSEDLSEAVSHKMIFEAGDYIIEARSMVLQGDRRDVLIVTPRCVGGNFGWSNVTTNPFPSGWSYFPKGTATAVAPNNEIAEKVLESVRSMT